MATNTDDLQGLDDLLENLDSEAVTTDLDSDQPEPEPVVDEAPPELAAELENSIASASGPTPGPVVAPGGDLPLDLLSTLRVGIDEMATMTQAKEFPEFFLRLARRTGLRLVLLKRWTSGLQVFMEENAQLPAEAKKKRKDGKAPIPSAPNDIFQATTDDATVYAGPVPVKHFPLDLTLMLGRGSRDRQIVILPLPSQNHWNTFLYLDAGQKTGKALAVAEILAHYALARMCLLNKGVQGRKGKVAGILKAELQRRQEDRARKVESGPEPLLGEPADLAAADPPRADMKETDRTEPAEHASAQNQDLASDAFTDESLPDNLTPEAILHHSGELPALPKAACHIMAVIEDPATTATKLEHALAMDQALTAKVLRIANSPFYGAVREITTVSEAIVRLGFVAIRNWTLVTAARSVFLSPGAGMLYQKIWRQSVMSAMAGQLVAQALGRGNPDTVFIGGLMQNIGQLVLARSHPELFQEILNDSAERGLPYHIVERGRLGFDHGELGALLIQEWNLSQELEDSVRWHHRFSDAAADESRLAAMIALGEEIALCSSGNEQETERLETAEGERVQGPEDDLSEAAKFLEVSGETWMELNNRAADLKIDPHFFS